MDTKIIQIALRALLHDLAKNKDLHILATNNVRRLFDNLQVITGNVNLHPSEKATEIALNTCIRKDKESQTRVAAFVTGLYLQHKIERAAQVGGSLLQRFGKSWFPHILDREKRFALDVDNDLENYLYEEINCKTEYGGNPT